MSNPFDQFDSPATKPAANPFDQFDPAGLAEGLGGSFRRGLNTAGQAVDAVALSAGANLVADARKEPSRIADEELADPMPRRENFAPAPAGQRGFDYAMQKWNARREQRADRAAGASRFTEQMTTGKLPALAQAIDRRQQDAQDLPRSEGMQTFDAAEGWKETLAALAKNPVEVISNLAVEGLGASTGTLAMATAAAPAGPAGMILATGAGSFATEYGNKIVEEIRSAGADFAKPETVVSLLQDDARMAEIREKAIRRGVPVAAFDAVSAGFAGRLIRTPANTILGKLAQGGAETAVQAAAGGAGEVAGSVAAGDEVQFKNVLAEVAGEAGSGAVEVARGALTRDAQPAKPSQAPTGGEPTTTAKTITPAAAAVPAPAQNEDPLADMARTLPDDESRDVLRGRDKQALERTPANKPPLESVIQQTADDLLRSGITPDQLEAIDFNLRFLAEKKESRRLSPTRVNSVLGPVLDRRVPGSLYFPLVEELAKSASAIETFRTALKRIAEQPAGTTQAPAAVPSTSAPAATPAPAPGDRATLQANLRRQIEERAAQEQQQAAAAEAAKAAAAQAKTEQTQRIRTENTRLRAIERTGRDPETREIVDVTKLPDDEMDTLDIEAEGLTMQQYEAEMERRARLAEERQARGDQGESLADALAQIKLPATDEALATELTQLREEMTPALRMRYLGGKGNSLDATAQTLRERGFSFIQTPADVIDYAQRALRGEDIRADRLGGDSQVQFVRRGTRPNVNPADVEQWWDETFRLVAPGVAREFGLAYGSPEALADAGVARRDELTGDEEAAYVATQRMFYLFERALRRNTQEITRLNLLHEIGHAYFDTLDRDTRQQLFTQWREEMDKGTGPLFTEDGELRPNVALGVDEDINEWFAERMAHANDAWAKRRSDGLTARDSLIKTLAAELRALFLEFREMLESAFGLNGYEDTLVKDFRKFLDQGTTFDDKPAEAEPQLSATAFARRESPDTLRAFLEGEPIASIAEDALPQQTAPRALREAILAKLRPATHPELGPVAVGNRSLRDTFAHGMSRAKVLASLALPDVVERGRIVSELPASYKTRAWVIAAPVEIGGKKYTVAVLVRRAFDSQRLYVHEAFLTEKLQTPDVKTGALQSSGQSGSGDGVIASVLRNVFAVNPEAEGGARFARRDQPAPEPERTPEQNLRDYASLERTRDRYLAEDGRVPRHVLEGLSELRMALENSLPGWRDRLREQQGMPPRPQATVPTISPEDPLAPPPTDPEPAITPETAVKRSKLEASTLPRPRPLKEWLASLGRLFTNFRSAIPELPGGADGRVYASFRQGFRMLRAATETVRKDAEEKVANVIQPLMDLGRGAVSPEDYQLLQELQQIRAKQIEAEKPLKPELLQRIASLEAKIDSLPYHLFRKAILYRDLYFRSRLEGMNGEPLILPENLTRAEIDATVAEVHAKIKASPHREAIEESMRRHYRLVKDVRDDLLERGYIIPEELRNPLYFPHVVIEKTSGALARVKLDTAADFRGYLQTLVGSEKSIETDYLKAMYYHMTQVLAHNARQDVVERYWKPYDIRAELMAEAKEINADRKERGLGPISWRALVPKDHEVYTVDDRIPVRPEYVINRHVLAERLGVALGDGDLQKQLRDLGLNVTLTAEDFRLAMEAGAKEQWVVPAPVAEALNGIMARETRTAGLVDRVVTTPQSLWKRWILFAPQNVIRYTYGNLVADLEKLFSADPKVFSKLAPAWREVRAFYAGQEPSEDLRAAFRRGVIDSVTANEVTTMTSELADRFEVFLTRREKVADTFKSWGRFGVTINRWREAAFRYAKFKADLERMRAGQRPVYAGAYSKDVEAITEPNEQETHYARAAEISRKTFGDYQDISVNGDAVRRYMIPFYSWMEVNFRYHANLFRNLTDLSAGAAAGQVARGTAAAASRVIIPRSTVGVLLRLALPYVAVSLWNNSGDREELEKQLSDEDRRRFHIIAGKDQQGRAIVIYAPTALSDVMKWFGGNDLFIRMSGEYARGEITLPQMIHEWATNTPADVLNNILQGVSPQVKAVWVALSKQNPFPDVLNQRTIADYDVAWNIFGSMTDGNTAEAVRNLVDEDHYSALGWPERLQQIILQARRRDPEQWGYYATLDRVKTWQDANGGSIDFGVNNKADAKILANFRRAIRAADVPAALEFYQKLLDMGYTAERFAASVRNNDPLSTLKKDVRQQFVDSLGEAERRDLINGYRYAQRMRDFQRRERQLFPVDRASDTYKQTFAERGGRADIFAQIMVDSQGKTEEEETYDAEKLLAQSLRN